MMKRVIEAGAAEIQREEEEGEQQCTQRDEEQILITAVWSDRQQVHGQRERQRERRGVRSFTLNSAFVYF